MISSSIKLIIINLPGAVGGRGLLSPLLHLALDSARHIIMNNSIVIISSSSSRNVIIKDISIISNTLLHIALASARRASWTVWNLFRERGSAPKRRRHSATITMHYATPKHIPHIATLA